MTGELIMSITYGIDVLDANDPYLKLAHQSMHDLAAACVPGKYLVVGVIILSIPNTEKTHRTQFRF
jgi:hypothetical protein